MVNQAAVGEQRLNDGSETRLRACRQGSQIVTELHGRYAEQARNGNIFMAHAIVTAPVIFSTAAGTGGPLLWNGSTNTVASILAVGFGVTVVTTVAAALGITGNTGQTSAPGSTTAIDSRANCLIGGDQSAITPYRVGTPTNAGAFFLPFAHLHTGALTVDTTGVQWFDVGGAIVILPGCWASIAASATATTTVAQITVLWEENPL